MNLENTIKDVITQKLEDGTVEKLVGEQLEKGINEALNSLFRSWGDGSKVIENKLKEVIVPYLENYDYSRYILKLDTVLVEILKNTALGNKEMLENFKDLMLPDEIKEIEVSDIFSKWMEYAAKKVNVSGLEVEFDDGPEYEYVSVTMEVVYDEERSWSNFKHATIVLECEHDEDLNREIRISQFMNYGWEINASPIANISSLRGIDEFSILLMRLAQSGTKIILDEDYAEEGVRPDSEPEASFS